MKLPSLSSKKKSNVNLIPKDSFETSLMGQILDWALAFGKWTVILTQLIVVSAFLMRFGLDRKLNNLLDDIDDNVATINSYSELERDFTVAQKRVNYIKPHIDQQEMVIAVFEKLGDITPIDVWYDDITFGSDSVTMQSNAGSIRGFNSLLVASQRDPLFDGVSIGSMESSTSTDSLLTFTITLKYGAGK